MGALQPSTFRLWVHRHPRHPVSRRLKFTAQKTYYTVTWLDLIHPTSTWTYWATLRRHSCLLRPATSASSQVSPIPRRSFLTMPLQFILAGRVPLLKRGTSQYSAWCVMRWWCICIVWQSQRSLLPLRMFSMLCCPVLALTSSFVTLSFQETPNMLLKHLWWAASSRFDSVTVSGHWPQLCTVQESR